MSSIRKKRNFKGLQLADSPLSTPQPTIKDGKLSSSSSTQSTTSTTTGGGSKNIPSLLSASSSSSSSSLTCDPTSSSSTHNTSSAYTTPGTTTLNNHKREVDPSSGANYHNTLTEQLKNLELGVEYKLDLKNEDLKVLNELGSGNGGTVTKVEHEKTGLIMARKTVFIDAKPAVRKQILRELQILHECNSPYIVSFYGAYLSEPHICMCLEFMDKKSLDGIWKKWGPIPPDVCGQVAVTVVHGLTYLYDAHRIIHRDVKPSNILVNSRGQIKICDFGVSGELINSIADTFVGTSTYMSPERIQGDQYSVKSDIWSLGISIIEIALGRFPFAEDDDEESQESYVDGDDELRGTLSPTRPTGTRTTTQANNNNNNGSADTITRRKHGVSLDGGGAGSTQMSMLELLQRIVNEPPPKLPQENCPKEMIEFVNLCVTKDPQKRPTPKELTQHIYVIDNQKKQVDNPDQLKHWVDSLV
ncbi:unnamed protein product [Sympodiomycopsis kandeliae]